VGALTFGQFLTEHLLGIGRDGRLLLWFLFIGCALRLAGRNER
jgi:hypothetical protein